MRINKSTRLIKMTIDETINEWTEKRDQLKAEYRQISRKPYIEGFKQEGLVSAVSTFLILQYLAHRHFLDLDVKSFYITGASVALGFAMGLICGNERGYSSRESEKMEELRDEINHHNEVMQSMRTAPERYDTEEWYRAQVARLEK